jgi:hypothetical protein
MDRHMEMSPGGKPGHQSGKWICHLWSVAGLNCQAQGCAALAARSFAATAIGVARVEYQPVLPDKMEFYAVIALCMAEFTE